MRLYQIYREQLLPVKIHEAWNFFSSPKNLIKMTPDNMDIRITYSSCEDGVRQGMIIAYVIKPIWKIPIKWVTEITHMQEGSYFVDEQRFGPYKMWHHEHLFEQTSEGVKIIDIVNYVMPYGWLGAFMHRLFVKDQLNEIFDFRYRILEKTFS